MNTKYNENEVGHNLAQSFSVFFSKQYGRPGNGFSSVGIPDPVSKFLTRSTPSTVAAQNSGDDCVLA